MTPQSDTKVIQMHMDKPFKTYGIYCVGTTVAHLGWPRISNFFLFAALGPVFQQFWTAFTNFDPKKVPKMDSFFAAEGTPKSTKYDKDSKLHRYGS